MGEQSPTGAQAGAKCPYLEELSADPSEQVKPDGRRVETSVNAFAIVFIDRFPAAEATYQDLRNSVSKTVPQLLRY